MERLIYPKTAEEFCSAANELMHGEHSFMSYGQVYTLGHEDFLRLCTLKASQLFPSKELESVLHLIDPEKLKRVEYISDYQREENSQQKFKPRNDLEALLNNIQSDLPHLEDIDYLRERITSNNPRIGILGVTDTGKSTFLNAIIQRSYLKTDDQVATNVMTIIKSGPKASAVVIFDNDKIEAISCDEVAEYTSEQLNPSNEKCVNRVELTVPSELPETVELLDIPGVGAAGELGVLHEEMISRALDLVDAAILVTIPGDGLKRYEVDIIHKIVNERSLPFSLVLNKWDQVDDDEREDLLFSIGNKLKDISGNDSDVSVFPLSAKLACAVSSDCEEELPDGYTLNEAKEESNFQDFKAHLFPLAIQVEKNKRTSILRKIKSEIVRYIRDRQQVASCLDLEKEERLDDINKRLETLNSTLKTLLKEQVNLNKKTDGFSAVLGALDNEKLGVRALRRAKSERILETKTKDRELVYQKVEEVYEEELVDVKYKLPEIEKQVLETIQKNLSDIGEATDWLSPELFINRKTLDMEDTFTIWEDFRHTLGKCFSKNWVLGDLAEDLSRLHYDLENQKIRSNCDEIKQKLDDAIKRLESRIRSFEETKTFNEGDIQGQKKRVMRQVEIAQSYLKLVGDTNE